MSERIKISWAHDTAVMRSSLNVWWQTVVPNPSISWRLIFWVLVWIGIFVAAIILGALGLDPAYALAGLAGVAVFIIGFFTLQRTRLTKFYKVLGMHWNEAGKTHASFGPEGVELRDNVSSRRHAWTGIDAIAAAPKSTVLRSGISMIAVPDSALPDELTPDAFRRQLLAWKSNVPTEEIAA